MPDGNQFTELDAFVLEQHNLYMLLFNLVIRHDDRLRLDVAEAIRRILQNQTQTYPVSPVLQQQLRAFRDNLLQPASQELTATMSQPPVRPVE